MIRLLEYWPQLKKQIQRVSPIAWAISGAISVSLLAVLMMQLNGPAYVALYDGLTPSDGGKVIAELQKLGIPYQLQAAGNVILVPSPSLAMARLQLGATGVPGDAVSTGWDKLEDAPMTASDLAQNTMATRALESSLEQSINSLDGISAAQVFIALPDETPFLADQPKSSASIIVTANQSDAIKQGVVIAKLVAGAVAGLAPDDVNVTTTLGMTVFPLDQNMAQGTQLDTISEIENNASARITQLLIPLVGIGNFRTDVAADLDFTQAHVHQISYGPSRLIAHEVDSQSNQTGSSTAAIGIPGAMSNEPPAATTAAIPTSSSPTSSLPLPATQSMPQNMTKKTDETYVTDESDSDIVRPDWVVKSIAISVVVNQASLGSVKTDQLKSAIAGAFNYPQVNVTVLAAAFKDINVKQSPLDYFRNGFSLTRGMLDVLAALALLFGLAIPVGRRITTIGLRVPQSSITSRPIPVTLPPPDFGALRDVARGNPSGVARLLQNWAEDNE